MPGFISLMPVVGWPPQTLELVHSGNTHSPANTIPEGQAGSIIFDETGEVVGGDFSRTIPSNSFAIYADTSGRFRIAIAEADRTTWFVTQPIAVERIGMLLCLFCTYDDGIFTARANEQLVLLDEEAQGAVLMVAEFSSMKTQPKTYSIRPYATLSFRKKPTQRSQ
jgi:hypothetical protein